MKVYAVMSQYEEDEPATLQEIFSTKEKAEKYVKHVVYCHHIVEIELDPQEKDWPDGIDPDMG